MTGLVFDIQKFSIHDGPGIRTNVFLKGCPLHCVWCHNPESWKAVPQILFSPDKCSGCRRCQAACKRSCHEFNESQHVFNRQNCIACGDCANACFNDALELCGTEKSVEDVIAEVLKDKPFYDNSNGGMTISGGEPMLQFDFTRALLKAAKDNAIHTALETCGFADTDKYRQIMPLTDLFLWDVKAIDGEKHRRFTGQDNALILENLRMLDKAGAAYILRCPVIPGLNDSEKDLIAIAELANSLANPIEIDVEPYHPLGISKAMRLGQKSDYEAPFTPKEQADAWVSLIAAHTNIPVIKQ